MNHERAGDCLPSTHEGWALVVPATCPGKQEHLTVCDRSSIRFLLQQRCTATTSHVPCLTWCWPNNCRDVMESKIKHQCIKKKPIHTVLQDTEPLEYPFKSQEDEGIKRLVGSGLFPKFILFLLIKISSAYQIHFSASLPWPLQNCREKRRLDWWTRHVRQEDVEKEHISSSGFLSCIRVLYSILSFHKQTWWTGQYLMQGKVK